MGSLIRRPSLVSMPESVAEIWINYLIELVVALESSMHLQKSNSKSRRYVSPLTVWLFRHHIGLALKGKNSKKI